MGHETSTLPTGVRVVSETVPGVRSVSLGLWLAVGSRDEAPAQAGCSHFLEHLLFKGTSRRSARAIAETMDAVGGDLNAFTAQETTCFYGRVLDDDLPVAFEVLADMLVAARNAPEDVEAERQVVLAELDQHHDEPDELAHTDLAAVVLDDHPLAREILGSAASISAMDRDTIDDYYRTCYRPAQLVVAAAGNVTHDRVVGLADSLLGDLGRPGGAPRVRTAPGRFGEHRVHVRHRPTEQAQLALGVPGLTRHDEARWALRVLSTLLGGGMSSRLFQEVRERRGLAYSIFSDVVAFTDAGLVTIACGTAPGKVDEVLRVVGDEVRRVVDDVGSDEVERAKNALLGGTVLGLEDTGSRMSRLGAQATAGGALHGVDEVLQRIGEVDVEQVRAVAGLVLQRPWNLAVVGPFGAGDQDRFAALLPSATGP